MMRAGGGMIVARSTKKNQGGMMTQDGKEQQKLQFACLKISVKRFAFITFLLNAEKSCCALAEGTTTTTKRTRSMHHKADMHRLERSREKSEGKHSKNAKLC